MEIIETLSMLDFSFWMFTALGIAGIYSLIESMIVKRKYENDCRFVIKNFFIIFCIIIIASWTILIITQNFYYYLCTLSLSLCFGTRNTHISFPCFTKCSKSINCKVPQN